MGASPYPGITTGSLAECGLVMIVRAQPDSYRAVGSESAGDCGLATNTSSTQPSIPAVGPVLIFTRYACAARSSTIAGVPEAAVPTIAPEDQRRPKASP